MIGPSGNHWIFNVILCYIDYYCKLLHRKGVIFVDIDPMEVSRRDRAATERMTGVHIPPHVPSKKEAVISLIVLFLVLVVVCVFH